MENVLIHTEDPGVRPFLWTRDRYERMAEAGILGEDDRVELIDGRIIEMSPQRSPHVTALHLIAEFLQSACPEDHHVRMQAPLALGEFNVPEPDLCVVKGNVRDFARAHPESALLVVEVSDTSLRIDRAVKSAIYARSGIPEYWIVDLQSERVEVYTEPAGDVYQSKITFEKQSTLQSPTLPELKVAVPELLP